MFLGVVVCGFTSSRARATEVGLDSPVQECELAKLAWIHQLKQTSWRIQVPHIIPHQMYVTIE